MAIAGVFFFFMTLLVKHLSDFHVFQLVFFRSIVSFLACLVMLKIQKVSLWGNNRKILILRGVFGTTGLVLFFYAIQRLPMSVATILQYLSPVFVVLLAASILSDSIKNIQWLLFALAFSGVWMIQGGGGELPLFGVIAGVLSAVGSAVAYTCIGKLKTTEHPLVIIFYFPLITIPITLPFVLINWVWPSPLEWGLLILLGVFVQIAQYFLTLAYQKGKASEVAMVTYLGVVYTGLADKFWMGIEIKPMVWGGISMIVIALIANTVVASRAKNKSI